MVFEIVFYLDGRYLGRVPRARGVPATGARVMLETVQYGPRTYRVIDVPVHGYTAIRGKADEYHDSTVRVDVEALP